LLHAGRFLKTIPLTGYLPMKCCWQLVALSLYQHNSSDVQLEHISWYKSPHVYFQELNLEAFIFGWRDNYCEIGAGAVFLAPLLVF